MIACIGAAHIDRKARALAPVVAGSSNPVAVTKGFGGVARNVAENLARLGASVKLLSRVGRDAEGNGVAAALMALGIDIAGIERVDGTATASYTALLEPGGQLVVALADMAIYDGMDERFMAERLARIGGCGAWFVDANLPAAGIAALAAAKPDGTLLAADTVSVAKAPRLAPALGRIDLLFCNEAEAAALTAPGPRVEAMARRLIESGLGAVVVTLGAAGALWASEGDSERVPAPSARTRDVTGAGDALTAAALLGRVQGLALGQALRRGLAAAALTVESEHSVRPDLSPALIDSRLARA